MNTVQTCLLFGSIAPSILELNQGADNTNPVCTNGVVNSAYAGKTNLEIAQLKAPYFFKASSGNDEIWAEEGVLVSGASQGAVPFIDNLLSSLQSQGGGCTMRAVKWWNDFLSIPAYGGEYPNSCPMYSAANSDQP